MIVFLRYSLRGRRRATIRSDATPSGRSDRSPTANGKENKGEESVLNSEGTGSVSSMKRGKHVLHQRSDMEAACQFEEAAEHNHHHHSMLVSKVSKEASTVGIQLVTCRFWGEALFPLSPS